MDLTQHCGHYAVEHGVTQIADATAGKGKVPGFRTSSPHLAIASAARGFTVFVRNNLMADNHD